MQEAEKSAHDYGQQSDVFDSHRMQLIGNSMNGSWPVDLITQANAEALEQIDIAVAYVTQMANIFDLASKQEVPLNLYTLADGHFPNLGVAQKFIYGRRTSWRLYLTRGFFHPKIIWLRGIGAYIGSANLTDKAWYKNLECGVWLSQEDLDRLNWNEELATMFDLIHKHCREATEEDLASLEELNRCRRRLRDAEDSFKKDVDRLLGRLPGAHSPIDHNRRIVSGGAAKEAFSDEWRSGLTILRKITKLVNNKRSRWPKWVNQSVPASIVQDQVTEWWWHKEFRRTRESRKLMMEAHEKHTSDPDAIVERLVNEWCEIQTTDSDEWKKHINETPRRLRELLSIQELQRLDRDSLEEILLLCHASREHGRQMRNSVLGLDPGEERSAEERVRLYSHYLFKERSAQGHNVREVMEFVLWGNSSQFRDHKDVEDRIWLASHEEEWKLPHLGVSIFGELIGYARPEEFPPRNNRVSKTLYALGYDGILYH